MLLGEAWGGNEYETRKPFVGEAGKELFLALGEAMPAVAPELHAEAVSQFRYGNAWHRAREPWLEAAGIAMTNVLAFRPPGNKIEALCTTKAEAGKDYAYPAIAHAKYLRAEYLSELDRLAVEIETLSPNVICAMGNTATWAVLRTGNISALRGTVVQACQLTSRKVLPTYHPASILYQWSWRPILVADLIKLERESHFPSIRRPRRNVIVNPTLAELARWVDRALADRPSVLACDIETGSGQIKCIGFARSPDDAIVVPFVDLHSEDKSGSFWPDLQSELAAWNLCEQLLASPIPLVGQNFIYDLQYLLPSGFRVTRVLYDTMLQHHSMFPEVKKSLGFLGSIYTDEPAWKTMRREKMDTEKRDE